MTFVVIKNGDPVLSVSEFDVAMAYIREAMRLELEKGESTGIYRIKKLATP